MSRPVDWSPLRGTDPVPGDPDAVSEQSRHASDTAVELRQQIGRLRRIGREGSLEGEYADRLRRAADELVGDLELVHRRYSRVAAALRQWEPQLREAQSSADRIRLAAQRLDDERRALRRQAAALGASSLQTTTGSLLAPTPAQVAAAQAAAAAAERVQRRLREVEVELESLDRDLTTVVEDLRHDGKVVAAQIQRAGDDDIQDTRWEDVKGAAAGAWRAVDSFVDRHIDVIKKVVEVLEYVAMALAVAAIFIPGVNLAVLLLAGAVVFGSQGLLYATGNGSATDLALATLGLVTLGTGALATKVIRAARTATVRAAAPHAGRRAAASARAETRQARAALGDRLGRNLQPGQRVQTRAELDRLQARTRAEAQRRAARAEQGYVSRPPMQATAREAVLDGGDLDNARFLNDIARTRRQFPLPDVVEAGRYANPALWLARGGFAASATSELGSNALGRSDLVPGKPYSHGFEELKASWDPLR